MKAKVAKKVSKNLRHEPVGQQKRSRVEQKSNKNDDDSDEEDKLSAAVSANILKSARDQADELSINSDFDEADEEEMYNDDDDEAGDRNGDEENQVWYTLLIFRIQ